MLIRLCRSISFVRNLIKLGNSLKTFFRGNQQILQSRQKIPPREYYFNFSHMNCFHCITRYHFIDRDKTCDLDLLVIGPSLSRAHKKRWLSVFCLPQHRIETLVRSCFYFWFAPFENLLYTSERGHRSQLNRPA